MQDKHCRLEIIASAFSSGPAPQTNYYFWYGQCTICTTGNPLFSLGESATGKPVSLRQKSEKIKSGDEIEADGLLIYAFPVVNT